MHKPTSSWSIQPSPLILSLDANNSPTDIWALGMISKVNWLYWPSVLKKRGDILTMLICLEGNQASWMPCNKRLLQLTWKISFNTITIHLLATITITSLELLKTMELSLFWRCISFIAPCEAENDSKYKAMWVGDPELVAGSRVFGKIPRLLSSWSHDSELHERNLREEKWKSLLDCSLEEISSSLSEISSENLWALVSLTARQSSRLAKH